MKNRSNFVHEMKYSKKLKNTITYLAIFILWIVVVNVVQAGTLVFILVSIMGAVGVVVARFVQNDSDNTTKSFKITTSGFLLYILLMYIIRVYLSKSGISISVFDNIYFITMIMTPVGYVTWQAKKIAQMRGIGLSKRKAMEYYKDHGNDGMM